VLWFGSMASVETACGDLLAGHPEATKIIFHLGGLGRIDLSAAMMLKRLMENAQQAGLHVEFVDVQPMAKSWVERVWS
jgi:anti-anti-sigma regulatory factor